MSKGSEVCKSKKAAALFGRLAKKATIIQENNLVHMDMTNASVFSKKLPLARMSKHTDYGHPMRAFFSKIPNILANWVDWPNKFW